MKTLALFSICLALPVLAEAPGQTPLTQQEHEKITLYFVQLQAAQIAFYQAKEVYEAGMKQLAAEHGACVGGQWNISRKEWNCRGGQVPAQ